MIFQIYSRPSLFKQKFNEMHQLSQLIKIQLKLYRFWTSFWFNTLHTESIQLTN